MDRTIDWKKVACGPFPDNGCVSGRKRRDYGLHSERSRWRGDKAGPTPIRRPQTKKAGRPQRTTGPFFTV
jgi:hypothetical protein